MTESTFKREMKDPEFREAFNKTTWRISDDEGIIHEGTEAEMNCAMQIMTWDEKTLKNMHQEQRLAELKEKYRAPHKGKLLMTQI